MDERINKYISENKKDELLDLALDLSNREEFEKVFDYLILEDDYRYIGELLSMCPDFINSKDALKIVNKKDQEYIFNLLHYGPLHAINGEFFGILKDYLNNK